jgi:Arc/MetJ family transcription regulator
MLMHMHTRTTIRLPDELYAEVRRRSVENGLTVTSFIEQALRDALDQDYRASRERFVLQPYEGSGLLSGVDLTDSAALLDLMDGST